jgi:RNA polymerase sporulation-specific sigma factor
MLQAILEFLRGLFVFTGFVGRTLPEALSKEEEERLTKLLLEGDEDARAELIERNLRLVAHIAKKYRAPGRDLDDLISIGSIGLIKAVNTYSPGRGKSLAAYAGRCVENEILMDLRSEKKRRGEVSLDEPIGCDPDGSELTVGDVLATDPDMIEEAAFRALRRSALRDAVDSSLKGRERSVIILRYGLDGGEPLPQRETARILGISRSYVSRIESRAIDKLRNAVKNSHILK